MNDIELMLGDCLDWMNEIPTGSIDLTVTSPPYDNLRSYEGTLDWGEHVWKPVLEELYRVTKRGGIVVWIVRDATVKGSETGASFRQALYAMECGFRLYDTMIWNKRDYGYIGSMSRYANVFEYMFILSKATPNTANVIRDRKNKRAGEIMCGTNRQRDGTTLIKSSTGKRVTEYGRRYNIWEIFPVKSNRERMHPAQYPQQIAHDHIISWSNEGDVVLDPFMGSGTTGVACVNLNRNFIGIEKVEAYFEIAKERIERAVG